MVNNNYIEFVNPKILSKSGSQNCNEGCLSIPKQFLNVKRPRKVTVEFFDRFGNKMTLTCEDFMARAVCHEYDHLDGILYVDRVKEQQEDNA
jgi:peptide deformylase